MTALLVNNFPVPVSSWRRTVEEIGERGRAFSGRSLASARAVKSTWRGRVLSEDPVLVEALLGLFLGEGFSFSFNADRYSDGKGLPVIAANGSTIGFTAPAPAFGDGRLSIPSGPTTVSWQLPDRFASRWTVVYWTYEGGAWKHYVVRSDGAKWLNGATTAALTYAEVITASGSTQLRLQSTSGAAVQYDDVLVVPYHWHSTWPALAYAAMRATSPNPWLEVMGDLMPTSARVTCRGTVEGDESTNRGAVTSRLHSFDFTLVED